MDAEPQIILSTLKHTPAFSGINKNQFRKLSPLCHIVHFNVGEIIIEKDKRIDYVYILISGKITNTNNIQLPNYSIIGRELILSEINYTETIQAQTATQMIAIKANELIDFFKYHPRFQIQAINNIEQLIPSEHIPVTYISRFALKSLLKELHFRVKTSIFLVYTFSLWAIYNLSVDLLDYTVHMTISSTYIIALTLIFFAIGFFLMILQMEAPLSEFGFNLRHWKKYSFEALWWSALFCLFLFFLKWVLINHTILFNQLSLFPSNPKHTFYTAILYALFAPIQEFIIQGAIQGSLIRLLKIQYAYAITILLPPLVFSALHIEFHFFYAIAIFVPSLMWAFMYMRQRSLLGVSISHAFIGIFAFWILGYEQIFNKLNYMLFGQ